MEDIIVSKRIDFIDYAKSLGMLLIIWGHIQLCGISNSFVYAFHIPLFFFLSGLVFSHNKYGDFKYFLIKKVKSLLIPYAIYSIITWGVWFVFVRITNTSVDSYWMPLLQTLIAQGSGGFLVHNVPLWFITCLFVIEIMYYFISKLKLVLNLVICLIVTMIGIWMIQDHSFFDFTLLPWNIEVACLAIIFFAIGNIIREKVGLISIKHWVSNKSILSWIICILCFFIVCICAFYNGSISMAHTSLGRNIFIFYFAAVLGIIGMLILCIKLDLCKWSLQDMSIFKGLKWFGRNSLDVMCIHNPIKGVVILMIAKLFAVETNVISCNCIGYAILAFIITVIISIICVMIINYIKRKYKTIISK